VAIQQIKLLPYQEVFYGAVAEKKEFYNALLISIAL
jgi:hypothetical protein